MKKKKKEKTYISFGYWSQVCPQGDSDGASTVSNSGPIRALIHNVSSPSEKKLSSKFTTPEQVPIMKLTI